MARREFKIGRFVAALAITAVIFAVGILFGITLSSGKITLLSQDIENARESVEGIELQFLIADIVGPNVTCKYLSRQSETIGDQAENLGEKLALAEEGGQYGPSFTEVKRAYTNLLIKEWMIFNRLKKTCSTNQTIVVYFYKNEGCQRCYEQGSVLTYLKRQSGNDFLVFPIDAGLGLPLVNLIGEVYGVNSYPSVIVNDHTYGRFMTADEIEQVRREG